MVFPGVGSPEATGLGVDDGERVGWISPPDVQPVRSIKLASIIAPADRVVVFTFPLSLLSELSDIKHQKCWSLPYCSQISSSR